MPRDTHTVLKLAASVFLAALLSGCAAVSGPTLPPSQMIETNDLADVSAAALELAGQFGTGRVLVVFDMDNTLLAMEQDLGADQWYDWQKELQAEEPCNPKVVQDRLAVQGALYFASAMRLTQYDAPALIAELQQQGLSVMILTSRGADFQLQTFRELRRHGFRFYPTAPGPQGGYSGVFIPDGGSRPALYEDGVFLTAGQHKGDMLKALLTKTNTPMPAVIVMADDKRQNLQAVLDAFAGSATSVQAFRYSREDPVVASFDDDSANRQWQELEPALQAIEDEFGPDNFDLPDEAEPVDCAQPSS